MHSFFFPTDQGQTRQVAFVFLFVICCVFVEELTGRVFFVVVFRICSVHVKLCTTPVRASWVEEH